MALVLSPLCSWANFALIATPTNGYCCKLYPFRSARIPLVLAPANDALQPTGDLRKLAALAFMMFARS